MIMKTTVAILLLCFGCITSLAQFQDGQRRNLPYTNAVTKHMNVLLNDNRTNLNITVENLGNSLSNSFGLTTNFSNAAALSNTKVSTNDARLLDFGNPLNTYRFDGSGLDGRLNPAIDTLQELAQAVDDLPAGGAGGNEVVNGVNTISRTVSSNVVAVDIVGNFQTNRAPSYTFTNIFEMMSSPMTNGIVYIKGYWGSNDWGHGSFYHTTNAWPTNYGWVVANTAVGGVWVRIRRDTNIYNLADAGIWPMNSDDPNTIHDSYPRVTNTVGIAGRRNNWTIEVPPFDIAISNTIVISNVQGFKFIGNSSARQNPLGFAGRHAPRFSWIGAYETNKPMFLLIDSQHGLFQDLAIHTTTPNPFAGGNSNNAWCGIALDQSPSAWPQITTDILFRNVYMQSRGTNLPSWFGWRNSSTSLNNCEGIIWENCYIKGPGYLDGSGGVKTTATEGVGIFNGNSANARGLVIRDTGWDGVRWGVYNTSGGFEFHNGLMTGAEADFYIWSSVSPIVITGVCSEEAKHAVFIGPFGVGATSGDFNQVILRDNHWFHTTAGNRQNTNAIIPVQSGVNLVLEGNSFGGDADQEMFHVTNTATAHIVSSGNIYPTNDLTILGVSGFQSGVFAERLKFGTVTYKGNTEWNLRGYIAPTIHPVGHTNFIPFQLDRRSINANPSNALFHIGVENPASTTANLSVLAYSDVDVLFGDVNQNNRFRMTGSGTGSFSDVRGGTGGDGFFRAINDTITAQFGVSAGNTILRYGNTGVFRISQGSASPTVTFGANSAITFNPTNESGAGFIVIATNILFVATNLDAQLLMLTATGRVQAGQAYMLRSNTMANWPPAPRQAGGMAIVNSNGVALLLQSGLQAVWTSTNYLQGGSGAAVWGSISGVLSAQTDLQSALDGKQPVDADLTSIANDAPGNLKYFGTDSGGSKGFHDFPLGGAVAWSDITGKPYVLTNGHTADISFSNAATTFRGEVFIKDNLSVTGNVALGRSSVYPGASINLLSQADEDSLETESEGTMHYNTDLGRVRIGQGSANSGTFRTIMFEETYVIPTIEAVLGAGNDADGLNLIGIGNLIASTFQGDGSGLTALPAGQLTGSINDARLSANVSLLGSSIDLSGAEATGTLAAGRFPALTGDVTTSAGALATTIASDAVTYAKMQNISATQRLLGRNTSGAGDTEELTISTVLDWISSTRGTIFYRGASGWAALAPGTDGFALTTHGSGADPTWEAAGGGSSPEYDNSQAIIENDGDDKALFKYSDDANAINIDGAAVKMEFWLPTSASNRKILDLDNSILFNPLDSFDIQIGGTPRFGTHSSLATFIHSADQEVRMNFWSGQGIQVVGDWGVFLAGNLDEIMDLRDTGFPKFGGAMGINVPSFADGEVAVMVGTNLTGLGMSTFWRGFETNTALANSFKTTNDIVFLGNVYMPTLYGPGPNPGTWTLFNTEVTTTTTPQITQMQMDGINMITFTGAPDNIGTVTNLAVAIPAGVAFRQPSVNVSLTADNQTVNIYAAATVFLSSDNGTAGNRTFVLTTAIDGAVIRIVWSGTNAGEIVDDASNFGTGNARLSATWTPTQYDTLTLVGVGNDWYEVARSAN